MPDEANQKDKSFERQQELKTRHEIHEEKLQKLIDRIKALRDPTEELRRVLRTLEKAAESISRELEGEGSTRKQLRALRDKIRDFEVSLNRISADISRCEKQEKIKIVKERERDRFNIRKIVKEAAKETKRIEITSMVLKNGREIHVQDVVGYTARNGETTDCVIVAFDKLESGKINIRLKKVIGGPEFGVLEDNFIQRVTFPERKSGPGKVIQEAVQQARKHAKRTEGRADFKKAVKEKKAQREIEEEKAGKAAKAASVLKPREAALKVEVVKDSEGFFTELKAAKEVESGEKYKFKLADGRVTDIMIDEVDGDREEINFSFLDESLGFYPETFTFDRWNKVKEEIKAEEAQEDFEEKREELIKKILFDREVLEKLGAQEADINKIEKDPVLRNYRNRLREFIIEGYFTAHKTEENQIDIAKKKVFALIEENEKKVKKAEEGDQILSVEEAGVEIVEEEAEEQSKIEKEAKEASFEQQVQDALKFLQEEAKGKKGAKIKNPINLIVKKFGANEQAISEDEAFKLLIVLEGRSDIYEEKLDDRTRPIVIRLEKGAGKSERKEGEKRKVELPIAEVLKIIGSEKIKEAIGAFAQERSFDEIKNDFKMLFAGKEESLESALEGTGYTPAEFISDWEGRLHEDVFESVRFFVFSRMTEMMEHAEAEEMRKKAEEEAAEAKKLGWRGKIKRGIRRSIDSIRKRGLWRSGLASLAGGVMALSGGTALAVFAGSFGMYKVVDRFLGRMIKSEAEKKELEEREAMRMSLFEDKVQKDFQSLMETRAGQEIAAVYLSQAIRDATETRKKIRGNILRSRTEVMKTLTEMAKEKDKDESRVQMLLSAMEMYNNEAKTSIFKERAQKMGWKEGMWGDLWSAFKRGELRGVFQDVKVLKKGKIEREKAALKSFVGDIAEGSIAMATGAVAALTAGAGILARAGRKSAVGFIKGLARGTAREITGAKEEIQKESAEEFKRTLANYEKNIREDWNKAPEDALLKEEDINNVISVLEQALSERDFWFKKDTEMKMRVEALLRDCNYLLKIRNLNRVLTESNAQLSRQVMQELRKTSPEKAERLKRIGRVLKGAAKEAGLISAVGAVIDFSRWGAKELATAAFEAEREPVLPRPEKPAIPPKTETTLRTLGSVTGIPKEQMQTFVTNVEQSMVSLDMDTLPEDAKAKEGFTFKKAREMGIINDDGVVKEGYRFVDDKGKIYIIPDKGYVWKDTLDKMNREVVAEIVKGAQAEEVLEGKAPSRVKMPETVIVGKGQGAWGVIKAGLRQTFGPDFEKLPPEGQNYIVDGLKDEFSQNRADYMKGKFYAGKEIQFKRLIDAAGGIDAIKEKMKWVDPESPNAKKDLLETLKSTRRYRLRMEKQYGPQWKKVLAQMEAEEPALEIEQTKAKAFVEKINTGGQNIISELPKDVEDRLGPGMRIFSAEQVADSSVVRLDIDAPQPLYVHPVLEKDGWHVYPAEHAAVARVGAEEALKPIAEKMEMEKEKKAFEEAKARMEKVGEEVEYERVDRVVEELHTDPDSSARRRAIEMKVGKDRLLEIERQYVVDYEKRNPAFNPSKSSDLDKLKQAWMRDSAEIIKNIYKTPRVLPEEPVSPAELKAPTATKTARRVMEKAEEAEKKTAIPKSFKPVISEKVAPPEPEEKPEVPVEAKPITVLPEKATVDKPIVIGGTKGETKTISVWHEGKAKDVPLPVTADPKVVGDKLSVKVGDFRFEGDVVFKREGLVRQKPYLQYYVFGKEEPELIELKEDLGKGEPQAKKPAK